MIATVKSGKSTLNINFEFKFDRNPDAHKHALQIRINLAEKIARKLPDQDEIISLEFYPVSRAGKSGSEVFYLELHKKGVSYSRGYIAKFQNVKNTKAEDKSAAEAYHARICSNHYYEVDNENDLGVIVYDIANVPNHREFRGFFLDLDKTNKACASALASIFKCVGQHPNKKEVRKRLLDDFEWYLVRKSEPLSRINSLETSSPYNRGIAKLASSIYKLYQNTAKKLDARNVMVFPYLVHGDLHARNLILNDEDPTQTELIDFGWVHYGHPAKDFVLMEATLKYMLLSELLPKIKRRKNTPLHMPLAVFEEFEKFLCCHGLNLPPVGTFEKHMKNVNNLLAHHLAALRRVYTSLIELRRAAERVLSHYCECHDKESKLSAKQQYFISLFLVTLGLNGFTEAEPIWTLVGSQVVGKAIWKT